MLDLVEKLKRIADAARYADGTDTPLGEQVRAGATEIERLRKGIQDYLDGNYVNPRDGRTISPHQKCPHGMFYWDTCENCIDEHFMALLPAETVIGHQEIEGAAPADVGTPTTGDGNG